MDLMSVVGSLMGQKKPAGNGVDWDQMVPSLLQQVLQKRVSPAPYNPYAEGGIGPQIDSAALDAAKAAAILKNSDAANAASWAKDTAQGELDAMPQAPVTQYTPLQMPVLPERGTLAVPMRQQTEPNKYGILAAALGGLFNRDVTAPALQNLVQSTQHIDNRNYEDALQRYGMQRNNLDQLYSDQMATAKIKQGIDAANSAGIDAARNADAAAKYKLGLDQAKLKGKIAGYGSEMDSRGDGELSDEQKASIEADAKYKALTNQAAAQASVADAAAKNNQADYNANQAAMTNALNLAVGAQAKENAAAMQHERNMSQIAMASQRLSQQQQEKAFSDHIRDLNSQISMAKNGLFVNPATGKIERDPNFVGRENDPTWHYKLKVLDQADADYKALLPAWSKATSHTDSWTPEWREGIGADGKPKHILVGNEALQNSVEQAAARLNAAHADVNSYFMNRQKPSPRLGGNGVQSPKPAAPAAPAQTGSVNVKGLGGVKYQVQW